MDASNPKCYTTIYKNDDDTTIPTIIIHIHRVEERERESRNLFCTNLYWNANECMCRDGDGALRCRHEAFNSMVLQFDWMHTSQTALLLAAVAIVGVVRCYLDLMPSNVFHTYTHYAYTLNYQKDNLMNTRALELFEYGITECHCIWTHNSIRLLTGDNKSNVLLLFGIFYHDFRTFSKCLSQKIRGIADIVQHAIRVLTWSIIVLQRVVSNSFTTIGSDYTGHKWKRVRPIERTIYELWRMQIKQRSNLSLSLYCVIIMVKWDICRLRQCQWAWMWSERAKHKKGIQIHKWG